jgi:hypothetical protein
MVRTLTVILVLSCATQVVAQMKDDAPSQYLLFGGVSENPNNVPYRETLLIKDRKVSPVLSLGSGRGFEFSITRRKTRHLAYTADFSGYFERFTGDAIYCQPSACGTGLRFEDKEQTFYLVAGPELSRIGVATSDPVRPRPRWSGVQPFEVHNGGVECAVLRLLQRHRSDPPFDVIISKDLNYPLRRLL